MVLIELNGVMSNRKTAVIVFIYWFPSCWINGFRSNLTKLNVHYLMILLTYVLFNCVIFNGFMSTREYLMVLCKSCGFNHGFMSNRKTAVIVLKLMVLIVFI